MKKTMNSANSRVTRRWMLARVAASIAGEATGMIEDICKRVLAAAKCRLTVFGAALVLSSVAVLLAMVTPAMAAIPYEACKPGYKGVGPVCWEACPAGYKDDGATCRKDPVIKAKASYGRGAGKAKDYEACRAGYNGAGPVCWQNCPEGFRNDGAFCAKPGGYDRGVGRVSKNKCEKHHGKGNCEKESPLWYKKCRAGFHGVVTRCTAVCPAGMKGIGVCVASKVIRDR